MNLEFAKEVAGNAELRDDFSEDALNYVIGKLERLEGFIAENGYGVQACATFLAIDAFDKNSTKTEFVLEGVTEKDIEKGNWKITIERLK